MVWTLVKDSLRRMWAMYFALAWPLSLFWLDAGHGSAAVAVAFSMSCAFAGGPFLCVAGTGQREVIYLPLSRRQLWRARMIVALLYPVVLLAVKLLAVAVAPWLAARTFLVGQTLPLHTVLFSSACDLAVVGAGLGLFTWPGLGFGFGLRGPRDDRTHPTAIRVAASIVFFTGPSWPWVFFLNGRLPASWSDLGLGGWFLLLAGLGIAVATLFYVPEVAYPGRRERPLFRGLSADIPLGATPTPAWALARLVAPEIAIRFGIVILIGGADRSLNRWAERACVGNFSVLLLVCLVAAPGSMGATAALRSSRALPISTRTLSAVLAAVPLASLLLVAIALAAIREVSGIDVPSFSPGPLSWFIGVAPAVNAGVLALTGSRFHRGPLAAILVGATAFPIAFGTRMPTTIPFGPTAQLVAVAGVAAAIWLNARTLGRSHLLYRR